MGRTIPSFRIASVEELKELKEFRQASDKKDRKVLMICFQFVVRIIQLVLLPLNL
jgi:hypothetical protein